MRYKVRDVFDDVTKYGTKIKTSQYLRYGKYPIFDQGKDYIAGYTNEEEGVFQEVPVILFGDHTGIIKYISKPCFLGADGVKLLKPKDSNLVAKYLFYALNNVNIPDAGYSRHFKWLKEGEIPIPPKEQQSMIVEILDELSYIVQKEKEMLIKFDELVKSRFYSREHWGPGDEYGMNTIKIKDVCVVVSGTTPKSNNEKFWNGTHAWITPAELSEDSFIVSDSERHITDEAIRATGLKPFPKGTVLLSSRAPIGKVAIAGCEMYCNQGFKNLICSESIYNFYLYYFLKAKTAYLNSLGRGATFKEISKSIVENISIPFPAYSEQIRIANQLHKISELIALRKKQYQYFDDIIRSRFLEIFGDMQCNPHKWTVKPLSTVCHKICDGEHGSVQRVDEGYLYLNAKNIKKDGSIDWEDTTYISLRDHERIYKRCNPEPGDILLTTTGTVGNVAIVPMIGEFSIDRGITLLKVDKDELNSKYLEKLLNSQYMQQCMKKSVHASAIGHLFLKQVKELSIMLPPLYLQDEFANYVTQVDKSKLAVQKSLDELETLKKSLMQTYFG